MAAAERTAHDESVIGRARAVLAATPRPQHSDFLVAAILQFTDAAGAAHEEVGVNSEVCSVSGSICAERAAAVRARLRPGGPLALTAVYIVATADAPITPGLLCREFLTELLPPGGGGGGSGGGAGGGRDARVVCAPGAPGAPGPWLVTSLSALYPHPCVHRSPASRAALAPRAAAFAVRAERVDAASLGRALSGAALGGGGGAGGAGGADGVGGAAAARVYAAAAAAVAPGAPHRVSDELYPLRYAAGVLLRSGAFSVARTDVGIEYGCTVDSLFKLGAFMEAGEAAGDAVALVLVVDSAGALHAPFAAARAWLAEHGRGRALVALHDEGTAALVATTVAALAPSAPDIHLV